MGKLSRKETAAIAFIIAALVCGLVWAGARLRSASASGVTLQEAFPQPPAGPPPGRPLIPVQPTAGGANAAHADVSVPASTSGSPGSHPGVSASSPPSRSGEDGASAAPSSTSQTGVPAAAPTPEVTEIVVHVAGAVHKPGVYHLPVGARNDEAIQKAGGPTSEANMDALNLAARVEDGSQLYLPTRKQHPEGGADAPTESMPAPATTAAHAVTKAGGKAGAHTTAKAGAAKGGKGGKFSSPGQGTVNINTATAEELERIPGIGPAMAERILEFRQTSGKFTAPEDLLQISGIGEKKFAKMQPFVRVK